MNNATKPQSYSERHSTYLDFTEDITARQATVILGIILAFALLGEVALRIVPPAYPRTAICSLHGARTIFQEAVEDHSPKIILIGDSTMVGGGVYDDNLTVAGRMRTAIGGNPKVYNLALPGGDNSTSLAMLDALRRAKVDAVNLVLIETIPSKFEAHVPATRTAPDSSIETMTELVHFIPYVHPAELKFGFTPQTPNDEMETKLEYALGNISMLYRNRDYFRTRYIGNYPSLWLLGELTPKKVKVKLFGHGGLGTNRLGARLADDPYDPASAIPPIAENQFAVEPQAQYLKECIQVASTISRQPPVVTLFPVHYMYDKLTYGQRLRSEQELNSFYIYFRELVETNGAKAIVVPSQGLQDPKLWLRTPAHFNAAGSKQVWDWMRSQLNLKDDFNLPVTKGSNELDDESQINKGT